MSLRTDSLQRRETSNWKLVPVGSNLIEDNDSQLTTDCWEPLLDARILLAGEKGMGLDFPGTRLAATFAARTAEFENSALGKCSKRRDVVEFGLGHDVFATKLDGKPDLNNAVSTVVVRALPGKREGAPDYWLRSVRVITLAEVFANYQHDMGFGIMYDTWLEGELVIRGRPVRGASGRGGRQN